MRVRHYAFRTERTYIGWIKRFILFHDKKHPRQMGGPEAEDKNIGPGFVGTFRLMGGGQVTGATGLR